jgi:hypothetical protein
MESMRECKVHGYGMVQKSVKFDQVQILSFKKNWQLPSFMKMAVMNISNIC